MEATWELAIDRGGQRPTLRSTVVGAIEQHGGWVYLTVSETRSFTRDASSEMFRLRYLPGGGYEWDLVVGEPRPISAAAADPAFLCSKVRAGAWCDPISGYGAGFATDEAGNPSAVAADGTPREGEAEYIWRLLSGDDGVLYTTTNVSGLLNPDPFESSASIEDRLLGVHSEFEAGFNMYRSANGAEWDEVFNDGLGNPLNSGGRALVQTPYGVAVGTANANTDHPLGGLEIWLGSCRDDAAPVSNAGIDRTYHAAPGSTATIALNGEWSGARDCSSTITGYRWVTGTCASRGSTVGTTARVEGLVVTAGTPGSTAARHAYALIVTDSEGRSACDNVVITASTDLPPAAVITSDPVANCQFGVPNQFCGNGLLFESQVVDNDGDGVAMVKLRGTCSDAVGITDCRWVVPESVTLSGPATSMSVVATVPVGGFRGVVVYLVATDSAGQVSATGLSVSVVPPPWA